MSTSAGTAEPANYVKTWSHTPELKSAIELNNNRSTQLKNTKKTSGLDLSPPRVQVRGTGP
jgi:hypothetical protein